MDYIKGKVISCQNDYTLFETNNIGYKLKGCLNDDCKQAFIYTVTNSVTSEKIHYCFKNQDERDVFAKLIQIKGFGPLSALKLLNSNSLHNIDKARKTGNIYKLNSHGIKPSILSLIIESDVKNYEAEIILIKQSLEKYGFAPQDISSAIQKVYSSNKKIDKNIIAIIKEINKGK